MKERKAIIEGRTCTVQTHDRHGASIATVVLQGRKGDVILASDENEARAIRTARRRIKLEAIA